jgi:hypothetical protein
MPPFDSLESLGEKDWGWVEKENILLKDNINFNLYLGKIGGIVGFYDFTFRRSF